MNISYLYKSMQNPNIQDVYILGSGASMNYFKPTPGFWKNKRIIGINTIFEHYHVDFTIVQHHDLLDYIINKNIRAEKLVISRHHKGILKEPEIKEFYIPISWIFEHNDQPFLNPLDFSALDDPNKLVVGSTTTIAALSFAYHIGAKNIFLCGIDGGSLNGETNIKGYYQTENFGNIKVQHNHSVQTNTQIVDFRNELVKRGVNVFSINPFVNMNFEGNRLAILPLV